MNDHELEMELRKALSRVEPGRDFSAMSYSRREAHFWTRSRGWLALAAVLVLALLLPEGVIRYQARQKQREGEAAREKLVTALRITGAKLQKTRQMVVHGLNRRDNL